MAHLEPELLSHKRQCEHARVVREQQDIERRDVDCVQRWQAHAQWRVSDRCVDIERRRQAAIKQELEPAETEKVAQRVVRTAELDLHIHTSRKR